MDNETFGQLLDGIRRFVNERLIPLEAKVAEDDAIPADALAEMRALGLFGISIPEEFGGLGLTMEEECRTMFEFCRCSPAFRSAFGTNVGIGSQGLVMFGTDAQKQKWLPGIASGDVVTSFALTEPEAGSDSGAVRTKAEFDGDAYVLNGSKRYITNANRASIFTVMARTNQDMKGGGGVSAFLVPSDLKGVSVGKPEKKMGQQGAHICDVNFDNVRVPAELRLGEEGQGFRIAMQVLDRGRLHISSVCVGVAERLIEESVRYAGERKQFGQAIANFQMIQAMLADCRAEANAGRAMVLDAARKRDAGEDVVMEAAAAKLFCSEMVGRVADRAVQIFGGSGYVADHGIERFYRDVRIFRLYEGTSEIQRLIIAREMMKRGK
ncbi:acyl-CoA dehydrogenase family protein [Candidatus Viadribacter manganicus]|uniref:Acyl-CoA dehydrogenase n=1 Tax=Candidatus Viadribacter manganicus TaxID=1759059 RepID=A0A1B1ALV0_9PROT|nr:acyl-CoA dehydrogenase family protein [Candidatus Viadribacter manganicus]ANP47533.1 acyl-CoA dehydrogenase [Candidatus Viadribacter manganicus]